MPQAYYAPLPANWQEAADADGNIYYFNSMTGARPVYSVLVATPPTFNAADALICRYCHYYHFPHCETAEPERGWTEL